MFEGTHIIPPHENTRNWYTQRMLVRVREESRHKSNPTHAENHATDVVGDMDAQRHIAWIHDDSQALCFEK